MPVLLEARLNVTKHDDLRMKKTNAQDSIGVWSWMQRTNAEISGDENTMIDFVQ